VPTNPNKNREAILLVLSAPRSRWCKNERLLPILLGGFAPPGEIQMKIRICKVEMNEIRLKHRSERKAKQKNSIALNCFGE
jgi:hypothetical protein